MVESGGLEARIWWRLIDSIVSDSRPSYSGVALSISFGFSG